MNIRNLVFFKSDGYQIPIHFTDTIRFTIIGNTYSKDRNYGWRTDATGFCNLSESGEIIDFNFENHGSTYGFEKSEVEYNEEELNLDYFLAVKNLIDEIRIFSSLFTFSITREEYDIDKIFDIKIGRRNINVRGDVDNDDNYIYEYFVESVSLKDDSPLKSNDIIGGESIESSRLYPSTNFQGSLMMEPVSTELVSTQTIFILERIVDENGEEKFVRPRSKTENLYLRFATDDSEAKFIKYYDEYNNDDLEFEDYYEDDTSKVYWSQYVNFDLKHDTNKNDDEPLIFTIGFTSPEEGCFENQLVFFTVTNLDGWTSNSYNQFGTLTVKNESIGEDERYRTLFANFGIPDPKTYPNLFKDVNIYEEGTDWKYLNKKSKELFLTYPEIFPYVGTYKALINAVNFLGYDDIYFKEWYKFFDGESETSLAYQSVDIINGQTLTSKLNRVGVGLEEFLDWKKLNKLSMMYHINQQEEVFDVLEVKDNNTGQVKARKSFAIPKTKPEYTYLNAEVLAKLYALKEWLQKYILNINCQIIDITGEGVYFERYKEQANPSPLYTQFDFVSEEYLTPIFVLDLCSRNLLESSANINVSIKEIIDDLTYARLEGKTFEDYFQHTIDFDFNREDIIENINRYITGKDLRNLTPFDSFQFELYTYVDCGTLKKDVGFYAENGEWVDLPLLVKDNEISVFGYHEEEVEFKKPPTIRIKSGNLRKCYGKWRKNIEYKIQGYFDTERTKPRFCIQHIDGTAQEVSDDYVTLYPGPNAHLRYTAKNKYDVPMFIIEGYDTFKKFISKDQERFEEPLNKFILEIEEGFIDKEEDSDNENGTTCTAVLEFEPRYNLNNENEQHIDLKYVYRTPDILFQEFDEDNFVVDIVPQFDSFLAEKAVLDKKIEDLKRMNLSGIRMDIKEEDDKFGFLLTKDGQYLKDSQGELIETALSSYTDEDFEDILITDEYDEFLYLDIFQDGQFLKLLFENQVSQIGIENEISQYRDYINSIEDRIGEDETYVKVNEQEIETYRNKIALIKQLREIEESNISVQFENIRDKWLHVYENGKKVLSKRFLETLESAKNEHIKDVWSVDVKVNHIGEYHLMVKAKDAYNIPYVNECSRTLKITSGSPDVYVGDFKTDEEMLYDDPQEGTSVFTVENVDYRPWFVPEYARIVEEMNGAVFDDGRFKNQLKYLDYSYYFDTPKEDDYLQMTNTTEKIDSIYTTIEPELIESFPPHMKFLKVIMNDETAGNQNVFYLGQKVYIFCIDKNSGNLIDDAQYSFGPYTVVAYKPIPEEDRHEWNDNYILLGYDEEDVSDNLLMIDNASIEKINNKEVFCHMIPCGRLEIMPEDIVNDYSSRTSIVKIKSEDNGSNLAFAKNQVLKVVFSSLTYEGKTHHLDELVDQVNENYISGTTYRCIDAYYDYEEFKQVYVLDGLVNVDLLEPRIYKNGVYNRFSDNPEENLFHVPYKIKASLAFTHQSFVSYIIRSTEDSIEDNTTGEVWFDSNWWAEDYLDNTFAFRIRKFDTRDAFKDWETSGVLNQNILMHTKPVIELFKDKIHVLSRDERTYFNDLGYMSIWHVYQNETMDEQNEYLLYELINDEIDIVLNHQGEYHFELTAIDFFGNRVVNHSQGYLKSVES